MKRIFTLFVAALISVSAFAQLPDGSTAPNWTLTDINGTEHTLYDYLDQGYTVVLDFSATWCGPCWNYHQSGALEELYMEHGPEGMPNVSATTTNDVMVFMIEGDASTNSDDLIGTGSSTVGDWTAGTPYPIIDDASITSAYAIGYWPTIYTVCPDRLVTESGQIGTSAHHALAGDCGFAQYDNDLRLISVESASTFCGDEYVPQVKIQNLSTSGAVTAATIYTTQSGTLLSSFDWTGDMDTYGSEVVDLPAISDFDATIPLDFAVALADDEDTSNDSASKLVAALETSISITLDLLTDNYGSETSWEFVDDSGNVVASGSGYGNNQTVSETVELSSVGCHEFIIYDSYGDGICCNFGLGSYTLKDADGNTLVTGGEFADVTTEVFNNDMINGVDELTAVTGLNIFPNPASQEVTISFGLTEALENTTIEVFNIVGQQVIMNKVGNLPTGTQQISMDVSTLENGIYMVTIANGDAVVSRKLQIQK